MANKLYLLFCFICIAATTKAQTYADQQRQYRSYQTQHLATVRAYSVPASSYSPPAYKSSSSYSSGSSYNRSSSSAYNNNTRSTTGSTYSPYARKDIKSWGSDDEYDNYRNKPWKPAPAPEPEPPSFYSGSNKASCQGDCSETLNTRDKSFTYTGNTLNGIPHGNGTIKWTGGVTYTGELKNGQPDGTGTNTWPGGVTYKGSYSKGQLSGEGYLDYGKGASFTGTFAKSLPANGLMKLADGSTYKGSFVMGEYDGEGTLTFGTNLDNIYTGQFKKGNFEGKGVFSMSKATFTGLFKNNKAWFGTFKYVKGGSFTGFIHENGEDYNPEVGEHYDPNYTYLGWFDTLGKRGGYGTYVEKDGTQLEGKWIKGDLTGVAMYTFANKQSIIGKIDYKGNKIFGMISHEDKWYPGVMKADGSLAFADNGVDVTEYNTAYKEAAEYLAASRAAYKATMDKAPVIK